MKKPIMLLIIIGLYSLLVPFCIISFFPNSYTNIINPIIWFLLFIITYFWLDKIYIRNKYQNLFTKLSIIFILFYFILYFMFGIFFGFAHSVYSHKIGMIIKNIIAFVLVLFFQEYIRFKIVNSSKKISAFLIITLLWTFIDLNYLTFPSNNVEIFKIIFSQILPALILNSLCTYLAYLKQFNCMIILKVIPMLVYLLIPIIPNLDWFYQTLFDVVFYFIFYIVIHYQYERLEKNISIKKVKKEHPLKKIPFLLIFGILIMFIIGVFPYVPLAILSNSMQPNINRGDAVIYNKNYNELKVGDIIVFSIENKIVVHRIYKINENGTFITKGDNNESIDNWVVEEANVIGIVKGYIPYIGYPAVKLSELLN